MKESDIIVIGSGKTGRGFIGRLLFESERAFTFIDKDEKLVEELKSKGSYAIRFFGNAREPVCIENFSIEHRDNLDIPVILANARLVFVAVGGNNLGEVGGWLAETLKKRLMENSFECSFVLCENADKPAAKLKQALLSALDDKYKAKAEALFGFSEATVFCTTIEDKNNKLDILSENYPKLQCDASGLKGNIPDIQGLQPVTGFENFLTRKLFTYNSASSVIAYLGWYKGYSIYSDAANDEQILKLLTNLYEEVGKALCKAFGYEVKEQREFALLSLKKFRDHNIIDTIARNAREPHRKLTYSERIIGPARLIRDFGGDSSVLELAAAAALIYENPSEKEWQDIKKDKGIKGILESICGLRLDSDLAIGILGCYEELKKPNSEILNIIEDRLS